MHSVNVNEDTVALLPGEGEQRWEPGVPLVAVQKGSALCLFGGCGSNTVKLSWRNFGTEKYTVNCMSGRHLKPIRYC